MLGLTPRYLFTLPCFSEILPDSQVDVLWDNIQFLPDPDLESTDEDDSPHVFLINGWGEPGSAHPEDPDADQFRRRYWSAWCAAHRPKQRASSSESGTGGATTSRVVDNGGLIILELELERDTFNPLYPMSSSSMGETNSTATGVSSPGSSGSGRSGGTSTSSGTLVSVGRSLSAEGRDVSESPQHHQHRPSLSPVSFTETGQGVGSGDSTGTITGLASHASASTVTVQTGDEVAGLEGEEGWGPTAEEILESTTNHAKPLPALERIRKMSRMSASATTTHTPGIMGDDRGPIMRTSRRGTRRSAQGSGVGMMDVFAVLAQINEQLSAANDLDAFLKIVVGVIKDLTQFHRVLVYQFDESWNGQAVAELADWTQTHDLYKGLHFPASDIPVQVSLCTFLSTLRLSFGWVLAVSFPFLAWCLEC